MKKYLLIFLISICFVGCYNTETTNDYVTIRNTNLDFYELNLVSINKGRGNRHTLDFSEYEFDRNLWIYLKSTSGRIEVDDIIWTLQKGKLYDPWRKRNIKGFIKFDSNKVLIDLSLPRYSDGVNIDYWEKFEMNGEYHMKFELDSISEVLYK